MSQIVIQGIIVDSKTKQGVGFANLYDVKNNIGTSTSLDGSFKITIPNTIISGCFAISCLGYKRDSLKYESGKHVYEINLLPHAYSLSEIKIKARNYPSAKKMLKRAKKKIVFDFCQLPHTVKRSMYVSHIENDEVKKRILLNVKSEEPGYKRFCNPYEKIVENIMVEDSIIQQYNKLQYKRLFHKRFVNVFEKPFDILKNNPFRYIQYNLTEFKEYDYSYNQEEYVGDDRCMVVVATFKDSLIKGTKYIDKHFYYINEETGSFVKYTSECTVEREKDLQSKDVYSLSLKKTSKGLIVEDIVFNGYVLHKDDLKVSSHLKLKFIAFNISDQNGM